MPRSLDLRFVQMWPRSLPRLLHYSKRPTSQLGLGNKSCVNAHVEPINQWVKKSHQGFWVLFLAHGPSWPGQPVLALFAM
mmetsp:Transcript_15205/g.32783  ORF Transcript_15205/g.32783 Transcript_15205/m.32783 type:complete len:80 (+) Transcript_15205:202-441(+)